MEKKYLSIPFDAAEVGKLRIGDYVCLTGTIYSARDAAHQRMQEALDRGEELPFPVKGSVIYYMGPTPARPGRPIGSAGPTTASRMDKYTPRLLDLGMAAMVGKGRRSPAVLEAVVRAVPRHPLGGSHRLSRFGAGGRPSAGGGGFPRHRGGGCPRG